MATNQTTPPAAKRADAPKWVYASGGVGCFLTLMAGLFALLWIPLNRDSYERGKTDKCVSNVKAVAEALRLYAQDYDEQLPPGEFWVDKAIVYTKNDAPFRCPKAAKENANAFGYALNEDLVEKRGLAQVKDRAAEPLLHETGDLRRNAVNRLSSLPKPPRHVGRNVIGFLDGHVDVVTQGRDPDSLKGSY